MLVRDLVVAAACLCAGCGEQQQAQSAECARFVACIGAIDAAAGQTTNLDRYVEGGACWDNEQLERNCTTSCRRTLDRMLERESALPAECLP